MIAIAVYLLCILTSAFCAALLLRDYRRTGARLLFWSCLAFIGLAVSNALVFADLVVFPGINLSVARPATALVAIGLLLYGLIWDAA